MGNLNRIILSLFYGLSALLQFNTHAYDIRCLWPRSLGNDLFYIRYDSLGVSPGLTLINVGSAKDTTQPFIIRGGLYTNSCAVLCLAYHRQDVLNPFTLDSTFTTVPEFGNNAYSVAMCQYQCWLHVYDNIPEMMSGLKDAFNAAGLAVEAPSERPDIKEAMLELLGGSSTQIMTILQNDDYHPFTMGHVAGFEVRREMENDGFNESGESRWCPIEQQEVPCSANCRPFQDTTGYNPVPDPRIHTNFSTDSDKYNCTGYCRHWQPEQNAGSDRGTILRENFALPHIGIKAKTFLRDAEVTLADPEYDYYEESLQVVERLRDVSSSMDRKNLVSFFHGVPHTGIHVVRGVIQRQVVDEVTDLHSYEEDMLLYFALGLIEYQSMIEVWREKVHHDLVRPTTVIKQWGNDTLFTYGGSITFPFPVNITARDFEPLIPTIEYTPEFPSEHSCYCTALIEFVDLYTDEMYDRTLQNITLDGSDYVLTGLFLEAVNITFDDMTDFRDKCIESRLDGGFHFPASVTAGVTKCSGLGALGMNYINTVRNNANFDDGWYANDTLPECPLPPTLPPNFYCVDSELDISVGIGELQTCSELIQNELSLVYCNLPDIASHCPFSCEQCTTYACSDSTPEFYLDGGFGPFECSLLDLFAESSVAIFCDLPGVSSTCRASCGMC